MYRHMHIYIYVYIHIYITVLLYHYTTRYVVIHSKTVSYINTHTYKYTCYLYHIILFAVLFTICCTAGRAHVQSVDGRTLYPPRPTPSPEEGTTVRPAIRVDLQKIKEEEFPSIIS